MHHALRKLFKPSPLKQQANVVYLAVVAQARKAFLYEGYGVPDTVDGRFDAILLHLFLLMHRLKENAPETNALSQSILECFVADMDRNLREMGVTDTGVGKRMKQMGSALFGRLKSYEQAAGDAPAMATALHRNLFREQPGMEEKTTRLALYVQASINALSQQPISAIEAGDIQFVS